MKNTSIIKAIAIIVVYIVSMSLVFLYGLREQSTWIMIIVPFIMAYTLFKFYKGYKEVNKEHDE